MRGQICTGCAGQRVYGSREGVLFMSARVSHVTESDFSCCGGVCVFARAWMGCTARHDTSINGLIKLSQTRNPYASPSKYPTAAKHCALVVYATDSQLTEQTARPQLVTKTETPLTLITQSSLSTLSKLTMETDGHDLLLGE